MKGISTVSTISQQTLLLFSMTGFMPVFSIVLHSLGILHITMCLWALIVPMAILLTFISLKFNELGQKAIAGICSGIVAVFFYDISRIPFVMAGWGDFIPSIGGWLNGTGEPDAFLGYAWRYIGNGGGMGLAYFMLCEIKKPKRPLLSGVVYGLFIFTCLMLTLLLFEGTQEMMFRITALTFTGSLVGHIVYGFVIGKCHSLSWAKAGNFY